MSPPKRRSQIRQSFTPSPVPERKPKNEELLIATDGAEDEEKFCFSFQAEGLTAKECAQKMDTFKSKEEFLDTVHVEEATRFITKVLIGRKGQPLKCMLCEKVYASSGGYWFHWQKCNVPKESDMLSDVEKYRKAPILWLKVHKKDQETILNHILLGDFKCFAFGCNKSFKNSQNLIRHLDTCVRSGYDTFKNRPDEFRRLSSKLKNAYIKEAMTNNDGSLGCFLCDRKYSHPYGLIYHIDRCGVEESVQPWKCYRCGFEAARGGSEAHLLDCSKKAETKVLETKIEATLMNFLNNENDTTDEQSEQTITTLPKRRRTGAAPRATPRKNGTTLLRFRKSTVTRQFNGIVTEKDQKSYEKACQDVFDTWKTDSDAVAFVNRLEHIPIDEWEIKNLDKKNQFFPIFNRQSVTITTEKTEGLQDVVPSGNRIHSRESVRLDQATVAYCGAPINGIQVAPGTASNGDEVICVTTFANETNLESDSSVAQFWRHRLSSDGKSEMDLWFLLYIARHGTILSMTWLQKYDTSDPGLIGYVAFSTTIGRVLIYRIDSKSVVFDPKASSTTDNVLVVSPEPHLILTLPTSSECPDEAFLNATIKVEGEDIMLPVRIDESVVPLTKITWSAHGGGGVIAAITALGAIAIWNLDQDLGHPRIRIDDSWQSPPTDISFLNFDHLVIGFKEKLVKVVNIETWEVKLEDNTIKTAGTMVHADSRVVHSFFTYNSEHNSFPFSNATSVSYFNMDVDSMNIILVPTGNIHQMMVWDVAMCAPLGTLLSCGVDGRLLASASGRLLREIQHPFFANRNLMSLKRRRILKAEMREPKKEDEAEVSLQQEKEPLEESIVDHEDVCRQMWLEIGFDKDFEPTRVELSCRDQRIESLNCVDATTNSAFPVSFTGGEAGLLFAVSSQLLIQSIDL